MALDTTATAGVASILRRRTHALGHTDRVARVAVASLVAVLTTTLIAFAPAAAASVVSVNFDSEDSSGNIALGASAGVVADTAWNNLEIGGTGGTDSGTFEGVGVSVTHFFDHKTATTPSAMATTNSWTEARRPATAATRP